MKARKEYTCYGCGDTIEKGDFVQHFTSCCDGRQHLCEVCDDYTNEVISSPKDLEYSESLPGDPPYDAFRAKYYW